jgi:hypothetical protein
MPLPTILFGIVLSTLYGSIFHYLRGGSTGKLFILLVLAWAGFWAGDSLGWYLGWTFWSMGMLNAGMGTVGSVVLLLLGDIASHIKLPVPEDEAEKP